MTRKLHNAIRTERNPRTGLLDKSRPRGFYFAFHEDESYFVRKGYTLVRCTGEAHSNPHIDNCARCAPLWGVVAVKF